MLFIAIISKAKNPYIVNNEDIYEHQVDKHVLPK
jgi:hypothetical protein